MRSEMATKEACQSVTRLCCTNDANVSSAFSTNSTTAICEGLKTAIPLADAGCRDAQEYRRLRDLTCMCR